MISLWYACCCKTCRVVQRRGAGVVDRDGLENRCTLTGTVGSNPTPSASRSRREILSTHPAAQKRVVSKGLPARLVTVTPRGSALQFSLWPVSPEAGDCAEKVTSLGFVRNQWVGDGPGGDEFDWAIGWRKQPESSFVGRSPVIISPRYRPAVRVRGEQVWCLRSCAARGRHPAGRRS